MDAELVLDEDGARVVADGAVVVPTVRDGVMGVNSVGPGFPAGTTEHPATSTDVVNTRAIRMGSG